MNGRGLPFAGSRFWSARTGSVRVAVKRSVWRSAGSWSIRNESSGANVDVKRRSASSRTCEIRPESASPRYAVARLETHQELDATKTPLSLVTPDEVHESPWGGDDNVRPLAELD